MDSPPSSSSSSEQWTDAKSWLSTVDDVSVQVDIKETISIIGRDGKPTDSQAESQSESATPTTMASRAYQLEMLEQSLKRNVIVAMDTGSGKTQVAVLRIKAELEKAVPHKLIWFLAPTVSLCAQQYEVIHLQNPLARMKLITGNDNAKTWSKPVWSIILEGTRLIISTPEVLRDALVHAFVSIGRLSLVVFDEAHNCVGNSPGSRIMRDFYFPQKQANKPVPAILGLTASPIMRSKITTIELLEATLDALVITPTIHREELLKSVNRPVLSCSEFELSATTPLTSTMKSLRNALNSMDIRNDPYIHKLLLENSARSHRALAEAIRKNKTFSQDQVKGLWQRSVVMLQELGPWAADHYISKAIEGFLRQANTQDTLYDQWTSKEKVYLGKILRHVSISVSESSLGFSGKARLLVQRLISEESAVGIVFVKERATVDIVHDLLNSFPEIVEKYRIGKLVGTSNFHLRKRDIYEFHDSADLSILQGFRSGRINLLIATSVLEEGIDVPACNLVICFDAPANLKAFIQRRGRARMRKSNLILLFEKTVKPRVWEDLEHQMKQQYEDEERERLETRMLEESEDTSSTHFNVEATGARLDFDKAKAHLHHFCRVLSKGEYVDCRPDYIVHQHASGDMGVTVLLPPFLPKDLRKADSAHTWKTEKNAMKDAAFQAYIKLYEAGLINDHLLPYQIEELPGVEHHVPQAIQESRYNPWPEVARQWQQEGQRWLYTINCWDEHSRSIGNYGMVLPVQLPQSRTITLYMGYNVEWKMLITPSKVVPFSDAEKLPDHTTTLLAMVFGHRWAVEDKKCIVQLFVTDEDVSREQISAAPFDPQLHNNADRSFLIRGEHGGPFEFKELLPCKPPVSDVQHAFYPYDEGPEDDSYLVLKKWTKRADFTHSIKEDPSALLPTTKRLGWVYPMSWCRVDTTPKRHANFAMLIPTIIHELEVILTATKLSSNLLRPLAIPDLQLIIEAISSRSAAEPVDYERVEFLGDSILKFCSCIQGAASHLHWPEGYLDLWKNKVVSNARLHRAAIVKDLPQFILVTSFTGHKWRPPYVDDQISGDLKPLPKQKLAAKMLADVVEALIGVSYQSGGLKKALKCISLFIDEVDWFDDGVCRDILHGHAPDNVPLPRYLEPLEDLIEYKFVKKSLLIEAMTHASFVTDMERRSLERLEFIGDAVLDKIIVTRMFDMKPPLSHYQMHLLKTATVNADFLAFTSFECRTNMTEPIVNDDGDVVEKQTPLPLWKFMRHDSPFIGFEEAAAEGRYQSLRGGILDALEHGTRYPWALLARLQAKKFYSDLFEALIGAIWVDSGSLEVVEKVLTRLGVLPCLDRLVRDGVHVHHPKEEIGKLAMAGSVTYAVKVIEGLDGEKEYQCTIHKGEKLLADVGGGVSQDEVKVKAAEEAVRFLTGKLSAMDSDSNL